MTEATWAAYNKVWHEWLTLIQQLDVDQDGPEVRLSVLYFVSLNLESRVSVSVLDKKLSLLAYLFKLKGCQDFTKDFWVKEALKGYRRYQKRRDTRRPVSFEILQKLLVQLVSFCSSAYEVGLFRAAFTLVFFGAFRIGELVSPSKAVHGGMLDREVCCNEDEVSLIIRQLKTDQGGKGKKVHIFSFPGCSLCSVEAVKEFLAIRPGVVGSFLIHADGSPPVAIPICCGVPKMFTGVGLGGEGILIPLLQKRGGYGSDWRWVRG